MDTGKSEDIPKTPTEPEEEAFHSRLRITRFTLTERVMHWSLTVAFFLLLFTGLVLGSGVILFNIGGVTFFNWPFISEWWADRELVKRIHIIAGFIFLLGPLLFFLFNWKAMWRGIVEIDRWERENIKWGLSQIKKPFALMLGRKVEDVPQGKFNTGQKFNTIFTLVASILLFASGFIMWQWTRFPEWLRGNAIQVHDWLTLIIVIVVVVHIFLAVVNPRTRESLRGITLGWVKAKYAKQHHRKWYEDVMQQQKEGNPENASTGETSSSIFSWMWRLLKKRSSKNTAK
ncbi:MAG: cytochrome b/b6 domain-containing protein [Dehalococcoidia bacterium]